ncbi:hypothetical protein PQX77_011851 [Marasmius sp. AFHP31]|nr:hypothetical protein PQX77_011851 [Marasmius sp. AFHP31]
MYTTTKNAFTVNEDCLLWLFGGMVLGPSLDQTLTTAPSGWIYDCSCTKIQTYNYVYPATTDPGYRAGTFKMSSIRDIIKKYIEDHPDNEEAQKLLEEAKDPEGDSGGTLSVVNDKVKGLTWWLRLRVRDKPIKTFVGNGGGGTVNGRGTFTGTDIPDNLEPLGNKGDFIFTLQDAGTNLTLQLKGASGVSDVLSGQGSSHNIPENSDGSWSVNSG